MIRRFLILAVLVFVPSFSFAQANRDAIAKQIESMERGFQTALQKGDVAAFKANIADDAVSLDGNGPMPIAEFLKMFDQIKLQSATIDQVKVMFLNDNAAVITYRWTGKGSMMGQPFPSPALASTTWANRGGKWVAVFHQETIATPPPPAKK
jgi:ketosteroid isomerase-like protein